LAGRIDGYIEIYTKGSKGIDVDIYQADTVPIDIFTGSQYRVLGKRWNRKVSHIVAYFTFAIKQICSILDTWKLIT
jgi:hypothetical protein